MDRLNGLQCLSSGHFPILPRFAPLASNAQTPAGSAVRAHSSAGECNPIMSFSVMGFDGIL